MKKVLILSYYFPPANFVAAERIASWTKYLSKNGVYPIVITRNWNKGQSNTYDEVQDNSFKHSKTDAYELYQMPYHLSLRDRLFAYKNIYWTTIIRKILTIWEILSSCITIQFYPYKNIYDQAVRILKQDPEISHLIISGNPFESFHFGHQLKKQFPHIHWIPDYRDEWTTFQDQKFDSVLNEVILRKQKLCEKRWTSNASFFLTVSKNLSDNIKSLIGVEGKVVMNGYDKDDFSIKNEQEFISNKEFVICYNGTIYPQQDFSFFIKAFKKLVDIYHSQISIKLSFIGIASEDNNFINIVNELGSYASHLIFEPRIPKKDLMQKLSEADVMLMTDYGNNKGFYPVKMFDYFQVEKPILLCPSDGGSIEQFIIETESGFVAPDSEVCFDVLEKLLKQKLDGIPIVQKTNKEKGAFYSREVQASILANILKNN